jgi:hypothetical protein
MELRPIRIKINNEQRALLLKPYNKQEILKETKTNNRTAFRVDTIHSYQMQMRKIQQITNKFGN